MDDDDDKDENETDSKPSSSLLQHPEESGRVPSALSTTSDAPESHQGSVTTDHPDQEVVEKAEPRELQKRLVIGNPKAIPMNEICIYMSRTNPQRSVTEENVHRVRIYEVKMSTEYGSNQLKCLQSIM
ncbi:hypothetical protein Avbf_05186 [Armadillidium vulgare]|nr:hypothetical protein Avbf_05186 [Armadillidium vulgare]